jgi:hypothetical protein
MAVPAAAAAARETTPTASTGGAAAGATAVAMAAAAGAETAAAQPVSVVQQRDEMPFQRQPEPEPDVLFAYRVRGNGMAPGAAVTILREVGGPRAPVLAFVCSDGPECSGQTQPSFPPGRYRFRVNCRRTDDRGRETIFSQDRFLELEAESGNSYLIDVDYAADRPEQCTAELRELQL